MTTDATEVAARPIEDVSQTPRRVVARRGDAPVLVGSECAACGTRAFPARDICFGCQGSELGEVVVGDHGTLYAFTTVHVSATRPVPYRIGYVDLEGNVRALARLRDGRQPFAPGCRVRLVADADDETWAFEPAAIDSGDSDE